MTTYYKKSDFKVGQEVVIVDYRWVYDTPVSSYGSSRSKKELVFINTNIKKIGRKYITAGNSRFIIDDNRLYGDSNVKGDLHPSIEAYKEHKKRMSLTNEIAELFSYASNYKIGNIPNEQIFQVADILGIEYKGEDENASEKNE